LHDSQPRELQSLRDLGCSRDLLTRPKSDSKRVEHLLNKFSHENTEHSYLSRPGGDRRSSTSSTTSSGFQPRTNSEKPKIKLQPTQYGRTQYTAKSSGDVTFSHASIRRNEKTPVSSLINRFNPSAINHGPTKGEDWMPATLKRVKRPSVKSQIAGLEKLHERPEKPIEQSARKSAQTLRTFTKERHYFEH